jgi:hypothetical protein
VFKCESSGPQGTWVGRKKREAWRLLIYTRPIVKQNVKTISCHFFTFHFGIWHKSKMKNIVRFFLEPLWKGRLSRKKKWRRICRCKSIMNKWSKIIFKTNGCITIYTFHHIAFQTVCDWTLSNLTSGTSLWPCLVGNPLGWWSRIGSSLSISASEEGIFLYHFATYQRFWITFF